MTEILIILGAFYVLLGVGLFFVQRRIIFPSAIANQNVPRRLPAGVESLWIEPEPGLRVEAWLLPVEGASPQRPAPLAVFFHGNAEIIDECLPIADAWRELGYSVLMPEYRSYGRSGGAPSQRGIVADALAFRALALERPDVDASRIVFHGRSIGGGVACAVAAEHQPDAMVLESTFTSVASFAPRFLMPPFVVRHPFRNDRVVPTLRCPVLYTHGVDDAIVPASHSRRLHEITPNSRLLELPGGHNDQPRDWRGYWREVSGFLESSTE